MKRFGETRAIVAKSVDYGESDRIVTLLSEKLGKISVVARGARRSRRRFGASLALFVIGNARVEQRSGGLWNILEFSCIEDLSPKIGREIRSLSFASYMVEVTREIWPADMSDARLYSLIERGLHAVARGLTDRTLIRSFELQLLDRMGLAPNLDTCIHCAASIPVECDRSGFSVSLGGILCPKCSHLGQAVSSDHVEIFRLLLHGPLSEARSRIEKKTDDRATADLVHSVLMNQLSSEPKSLNLLDSALLSDSPAGKISMNQ